MNTFLSIVSYMPSKRRILIDSSTHTSAVVCHLKARSQQEFETWLELLKQHRLYYQYKWSHANPSAMALIAPPGPTGGQSQSVSGGTMTTAAVATTVTALSPLTQSLQQQTTGTGSQPISNVDTAQPSFSTIKGDNRSGLPSLTAAHHTQSSAVLPTHIANDFSISNNVNNTNLPNRLHKLTNLLIFF